MTWRGRDVPVVAAMTLDRRSDSPDRNRYVSYLYHQGYALASIGKVLGISRQAVHQSSRRYPDGACPPGWPTVPAVKTEPKTHLPPLDPETLETLKVLWVLGSERRRGMGPDTVWGKAALDFVAEVQRLEEKGHSKAQIARAIKVDIDALYRRMQRAGYRRWVS